MTPEQVERVFTSLGEIKAKIETHGEDIKKIKDTVTGNGHPEQSMVAVMHDTRRIVGELKKCQDIHERRIKALEDNRVRESLTKEVNAETKKRIFAVVSLLFKKNPLAASAISAAITGILTWLGFLISNG